MALVSYDSSESEEELEQLPKESLEIKNNKNKNESSSLSNDDNIKIEKKTENQSPDPLIIDEDLKSSKSFLKLPQPSNFKASIPVVNNLTTIKEKSKVKIFLPSYNGKADDEYREESDDEKESKQFKFSSSKGSGLKSLLPPPKHRVTAKTTSFLPNVLKRPAASEQRRSAKFLKASSNHDELDDSNDDESVVNFFTFDKIEKDNEPMFVGPSPVESIRINKYETDLLTTKKTSSSVKAQECSLVEQELTSDRILSQPSTSSNSETQYQQERKLKYEIEKRFGEQVGDDIQIQEVNIASQLNNNLDYLKTVSEERDALVKGPAPSSMAKRKHQITYLAYQAKQNEIKLKNEWAQGRINREQSRSRYGF